MTFANNMDRDQAPRNVGPDLQSILFEAQHQLVLKTCIAWDDLDSEDIEIFYFNLIYCPRTFGWHCRLIT